MARCYEKVGVICHNIGDFTKEDLIQAYELCKKGEDGDAGPQSRLVREMKCLMRNMARFGERLKDNMFGMTFMLGRGDTRRKVVIRGALATDQTPAHTIVCTPRGYGKKLMLRQIAELENAEELVPCPHDSRRYSDRQYILIDSDKGYTFNDVIHIVNITPSGRESPECKFRDTAQLIVTASAPLAQHVGIYNFTLGRYILPVSYVEYLRKRFKIYDFFIPEGFGEKYMWAALTDPKDWKKEDGKVYLEKQLPLYKEHGDGNAQQSLIDFFKHEIEPMARHVGCTPLEFAKKYDMDTVVESGVPLGYICSLMSKR